MREILFKGKSKRDGQWVVGSYVNVGNGVNQIWVAFSKEEREMHKGMAIEGDYGYWEEIIPETLCEYTNLTDKNGKRIWENDIVLTQPFYDRPYSDKRKSKQFWGIVEYQTSTFNGNKFYPKQVYQGKWGLKYNEEHGKFVHFSWGDLWGCEVIGNSIDNPELLTAERSGENEN